MRLFTSSAADIRRLTMLPFQMAKQHPGRREWIHGRIHAMDCRCKACRRVA